MNCVDDIIQTYRDAKTKAELMALGEKTMSMLEALDQKGALIPNGIEEGLRANWKYYRDKLETSQLNLL